MNKYAAQRLVPTALLALFLFSPATRAVTLSLYPASQTVAPDGSATVELSVSGLADLTAPSIGAFLVEITFDESILSFDSVAYGAFLGNPFDSNETDIVTTVGIGSVSLDEFSFLFDFELDAIQPASFTLATLQFTGDNTGMSALGFGALDLSDAVGFTITPTLETGDVTVVPLPAAFPLFLSALGCLIGFKRVKR